MPELIPSHFNVNAPMNIATEKVPDVNKKARVDHQPSTAPSLRISGLLVLELCAGSAGLTAELRRKGFDSVAVDCE